jgi:hypothetical protein
MTSQADRHPGSISYVQHLIDQINAGGGLICGPPVYDWPTFWQRFWATRPDHALELTLERQLQHPELEAGG